jgi:5'-nucleotidase
MIKPIIYVDMDGVLCDYMTHARASLKHTPEIGYPQAQFGFFANMPPMPGALEAYMFLHENFETYILTRPSVLNPLSYTEKRVWVEKHLGIEICDNLIMSCHKGLLKGDYLIDDTLWPKFDGTQIEFGSKEWPDWEKVVEFFKERHLGGPDSLREKLRILLVEAMPKASIDQRSELNVLFYDFDNSDDVHAQLENLKAIRILMIDDLKEFIPRLNEIANAWVAKNRHRMDLKLARVVMMSQDSLWDNDVKLFLENGKGVSMSASDVFKMVTEYGEEAYLDLRGNRYLMRMEGMDWRNAIGMCRTTPEICVEVEENGEPRVYYGKTAVIMDLR